MSAMGNTPLGKEYIKRREILSTSPTNKLIAIIESYETKPLYQRTIHSALSTKTFLNYRAAADIKYKQNMDLQPDTK